eukprot:TRINITY_DN2341_c0_g1_i2.p3 TRINITY_DN2341_c0_g1~~TRINITY_DN2341_c0_g1_i2.p3  ORF type:complete len:220 (-),score=12.30 TRINITY_DN2341_c0_g1_i2:515-1174(-)
MSQKSCTGITLRILLCFTVLAGIAIIAIALVLENPPKSLPVYAMIIIGVLQLVAALFGCISTCAQMCCHTIFLVLYLLSWIPLLILTIGMFVKTDDIVDEVDKRVDDNKQSRQQLEDRIDIVKYVFIVICAIELFSIILGFLRYLSIRGEMTDNYKDLDRSSKLSKGPPTHTFLSRLRKDIEMGKQDKEKESEYQKIKRRIQEKYGKAGSKSKNGSSDA